MATHPSIFVWKIPWTEEPSRLYSPWGHNESDTTKVTKQKNMKNRYLAGAAA